MAEHESAAVTPWYELSGMEREIAKYDQCEEPGYCDHDHDNAIEYFREQELAELRAEVAAANERAEEAEAELAKLRKEHRDAYLVVMEERDDARNAMRIERAERDEARARLAELGEARGHG